MTVQDILCFIDSWAPSAIAWERDNVGLQVGNPGARVSGILVALDVTEDIIEEARRRKANLLITHHPLLFSPLKSVSSRTGTGRCIERLMRWKIHCLAAHTNLDFTRGGTSFALAETLGIQEAKFLRRSFRLLHKVVTFVPAEYVDKVSQAMAAAGAGTIGEYRECSFRTEGLGTFKGSEASNPSVGRRGKREEVPEVRLEMIVEEPRLSGVLAAMQAVHPYEEVAYDIYPLRNHSFDYGMGAIGELKAPTQLGKFLSLTKRALKARGLRFTGNVRQRVSRIAVCGGSGSDLLNDALRDQADVFVTADVRYHTFHDAVGKIALVDAGHYETEHPVLATLVQRLSMMISDTRIPIYQARTVTNPIQSL
jgi:dinuclear metal center YbgI/SA1388 family protein